MTIRVTVACRFFCAWLGMLGLDGVERFSTNSFDNLPAAGEGRWLGDDTFLLQLDLVGGINCYHFKLTFSEQGKRAQVAWSERTGLNEETFEGAEAR